MQCFQLLINDQTKLFGSLFLLFKTTMSLLQMLSLHSWIPLNMNEEPHHRSGFPSLEQNKCSRTHVCTHTTAAPVYKSPCTPENTEVLELGVNIIFSHAPHTLKAVICDRRHSYKC